MTARDGAAAVDLRPNGGGTVGGSRLPSLLLIGILLAAAYTGFRALTLRTEYSDGYVFLMGARLFSGDPSAGFDARKPPLVPLLQAPVVMAARAGGPANRWLIVGPHLANAALSLLCAGAVLRLYGLVFPRALSLLGVLLFMASRMFVRYAAHVMSDVLAAGLCATSVWLLLRSGARSGAARWLGYALSGVAAGAAVLCRHNVAPILGSLVATEAILSLGAARRAPGRRLRTLLDPWRNGGVVLACVTAVVTFAAVETPLVHRFFGGWPQYFAHQREYGAWNIFGLKGESRLDHLTMAWAVLSPPVVLLAAAGLLVAAFRPERRDAAFLPWLALLGAGHVVLIVHSEARYLLPAVPPALYFAVRAVEAALAWLRGPWAAARPPWRRAGAAAVAAVTMACLFPGVRQAWDDRDPVFRRDAERRAAAKMLVLRRGDGRLRSMGRWHTLFPSAPARVTKDEFWNCLHLSNGVFEYYLGERVIPLATRPWTDEDLHRLLAADSVDGDAIVRLHGKFHRTDTLPRGEGAPDLEVLAVRRIDLRRGPGGAWTSPGATTLSATLDAAAGLVLAPDRGLGEHRVVAMRTCQVEPDLLGAVDVAPGARIPLPSPEEVDSVVLLRVEVHEASPPRRVAAAPPSQPRADHQQVILVHGAASMEAGTLSSGEPVGRARTRPGDPSQGGACLPRACRGSPAAHWAHMPEARVDARDLPPTGCTRGS